MKIGILTFHCAHNYGAVLQAYGLQEYLKSLGHEVYIIDYRPDYLIEPYQLFKWKFDKESSLVANTKDLIRECLVMPIRFKRNLKFQQFVSKYLNLYSWDDDLNIFDSFVFGSDQIWNPKITKGLDGVFLGQFKEAVGKKLIAYAASAGCGQNLSTHDFKELSMSLKSFVQVGVRENALYEKLSAANDNVYITIDPVLLAGKKTFSDIASDVNIEKPYLLCFTLGRDEYAVKEAEKIAKQKQLRIIEIISSSESLYNSAIKQMLSPTEFLGYMKGADFVVTSSFHGTVFSILFHKPFICVSNATNGMTRFHSLLNVFRLEDYLVDTSNQNRLDLFDIIWDSVDDTLLRKQIDAKMFLETSLKSS